MSVWKVVFFEKDDEGEGDGASKTTVRHDKDVDRLQLGQSKAIDDHTQTDHD